MPKPILSELEYNADDVASAILSKADLSITNEDLGVTDQSSILSLGTGVTHGNVNWYSFNGFMFCSGQFSLDDVPTSGDVMLTVTESEFRPANQTLAPTIALHGDFANGLAFNTDGTVEIWNPENEGWTAWYCTYNCYYRY